MRGQCLSVLPLSSCAVFLVALNGPLQYRPCRGRIADGGLLVDTEDEREVKRVGAVGEGLFELTVDAELFENRN